MSQAQYQGAIAAEVLLVLPGVFGIGLVQFLPQVVGGDVATAPSTLTPPPIRCGLSQNEDLFSSQETELERKTVV